MSGSLSWRTEKGTVQVRSKVLLGLDEFLADSWTILYLKFTDCQSGFQRKTAGIVGARGFLRVCIRPVEEALRELSGVLGRIILVSHQEEFARYFSLRYAIELVNGASRARLVDGTGI